jgi:aspartate/methionine/tyrosine aminotransferase
VWSAPGLKTGWILADSNFIDEYYEYASTSFGGPPSFFYTMVEVLARMERWIVSNVEPGTSEVNEFEPAYNLDLARVQAAYESYRNERIARENTLKTLRDACLVNLTQASAKVVRAPYSINMAVEFSGWNDSYKCFRDLLRETNVAVFPGILAFCFSGGIVRITTARAWDDLSTAMSRLRSFTQLKTAANS